jgi:hypothetical protein
MRAYEIASRYLQYSWRSDYPPPWYPALIGRWQQRIRSRPDHLAVPGCAVHPECTALAAVFASPYWAALAVPAPDRRHRLFYQRLLAELGVDNGTYMRTMRIFDPLPDDIQEQARWGRILSAPGWGICQLLRLSRRRSPSSTSPTTTNAPSGGFSGTPDNADQGAARRAKRLPWSGAGCDVSDAADSR